VIPIVFISADARYIPSHQQEGTLLANFRALFSAFSLVSQPTSRQVDKPEAKFSKFIISIYFK
jgi:hypothetical protein